jgi:hypothetical protein
MRAYYPGTAYFEPSASPYWVQTVDLNPTTTALVSSQNPANVGTTITFTATVTPVTGSATPTGTVTFKDYGTVIGSAVLAGNTASFSTSSLAGDVGHALLAVYEGDANYAPSGSAWLNQVVNKLASSMGLLTCSPNPSASGSAVTCNGTLTGPGTGAVIEFTSGPTYTTVLAQTTTEAGGTFSGSVPLSIKGTYGVSATYAGDATYRSAVATATQTVR